MGAFGVVYGSVVAVLGIISGPQWALLNRAEGKLIMRADLATVRRFAAMFSKLGISVDYRRDTQHLRKVA